jgi:hypothetical protein
MAQIDSVTASNPLPPLADIAVLSARGGANLAAFTTVTASQLDGAILSVSFVGSPRDVEGFVLHLPERLSALESHTGTAGAGPASFRVGLPSGVSLVLAACYGCPTLGATSSELTLGDSLRSDLAILTALPSSGPGDLLVQSPTATSSWAMQVMSFAP